jgi:hypothetical protein
MGEECTDAGADEHDGLKLEDVGGGRTEGAVDPKNGHSVGCREHIFRH